VPGHVVGAMRAVQVVAVEAEHALLRPVLSCVLPAWPPEVGAQQHIEPFRLFLLLLLVVQNLLLLYQATNSKDEQ